MKAFTLLASAASDNANLLTSKDTFVQTIIGCNTAAQPRFLKLYDLDVVPASTDAPAMTIRLPASSDFAIPVALRCDTGLGMRITGAAPDADTAAIGAGDIACLNIVLTA